MRSDRKRWLTTVLFVGGTLTVACGQAKQVGRVHDAETEEASPRFTVHGGVIKIPLGAFLLVRKNGEMGAIRITSVDSNATEFFGKSNYESIFQQNISAKFAENAATYRGEIEIQDLRGPGRGIYVYRPSGYKAQIGKWKLDFQTPDSISMSDSSFWTGRGDHGFEFAPTSACQVSEIDASDKRLRWFRWDKTTEVDLPLADLPK
jgi:hypothetical protein